MAVKILAEFPINACCAGQLGGILGEQRLLSADLARRSCSHHCEKFLRDAIDINRQRNAAVHYDGETNLAFDIQLRCSR